MLELNTLGKRLEGEDPTACLTEMTRVVVRLEPDEIRAEEAVEELLANLENEARTVKYT